MKHQYNSLLFFQNSKQRTVFPSTRFTAISAV